jgi:hypothetical protein
MTGRMQKLKTNVPFQLKLETANYNEENKCRLPAYRYMVD